MTDTDRRRPAHVLRRFARSGEPRQSRGAICGSDLGSIAIDQRPLQRGGQYAAPPHRARAATDDGNPVDARAGLDQHIETVGKCERYAFEHCLTDRRGIRIMRETEQHAARMGVVVGRAFARQVRQENLSAIEAAAGFDLRQQVGGIARASELDGPIQTARSTQHDAHLMPQPGQTMTERMNGPIRIRQERRRHQEQHAGRAQRQECVTCLNDTDASRSRCIVTPAPCDGHS